MNAYSCYPPFLSLPGVFSSSAMLFSRLLLSSFLWFYACTRVCVWYIYVPHRHLKTNMRAKYNWRWFSTTQRLAQRQQHQTNIAEEWAGFLCELVRVNWLKAVTPMVLCSYSSSNNIYIEIKGGPNTGYWSNRHVCSKHTHTHKTGEKVKTDQKSFLNKLQPTGLANTHTYACIQTFILIWYRWIICINDIVLAKKITLFFVPLFPFPFFSSFSASSKRWGIQTENKRRKWFRPITTTTTCLIWLFSVRPHSYSFIWIVYVKLILLYERVWCVSVCVCVLKRIVSLVTWLIYNKQNIFFSLYPQLYYYHYYYFYFCFCRVCCRKPISWMLYSRIKMNVFV